MNSVFRNLGVVGGGGEVVIWRWVPLANLPLPPLMQPERQLAENNIASKVCDLLKIPLIVCNQEFDIRCDQFLFWNDTMEHNYWMVFC